jgi:hypothetical protein
MVDKRWTDPLIQFGRGFQSICGGFQNNRTSTTLCVGLGLLALVILLLLSALLGVLARGFLAKISVDEVFLVYRNGSLIKHTVINKKMEIDEDILSGMLTAIQEFVRDSFGKAENTLVERIDFGKRRIMIKRGGYSYLAVVYTGHETKRNVRPIKDALDEIEEKFAKKLEVWTGFVHELSGVEDILYRHLGEPGN